ncbi:MAG: heat-inducible transcription repressor HrcA [Proteobacteria bacterium]|nr:heat-inducible transcription repressor HrcA [Pseudomonadota bacterium]
MDQRAEIILEKIVDHYVQTAEPVGSRALAKIAELDISAATIRNIMSDLTDMGLIVQPHISAGRIPTDKGYRYYINKVLKKIESSKYEFRSETSRNKENQPVRLEDILLDATQELSSMTNFTGVIISPQPSVSRLKKIELIRLNDTQILIVLVTQIGMVRNKIVHLRECPDQETLDSICKVLCDLFEGEIVTEIRSSLVKRLTEHQAAYDDLLVQAIRLGKKAFNLDIANELFVFGRSKMCSFPEFSDQESLQEVYQILDDKTALFNTLVSVMDSDKPLIKIGNENEYFGLDQCSVVAGTYGNREYLLGSIGVIGPTRMNYLKVISEIDYSAQKLSYEVGQFLDNN